MYLSASSRSAHPRSRKCVDGNKKAKGVKRNIMTDKDGDILEATTTPANFYDSRSAYALVALLVTAYPWINGLTTSDGSAGIMRRQALRPMRFSWKLL